jgi:predicted nucleotidyltransferase
MNTEQEITSFLRRKYKPEAILLIGSRADGTATQNSDWDIILFAGKRRPGISLKYKGATIDIIFSAWPPLDSYLDTQFGPVYPTKVIFDKSNGKLEKIVKNTERAYRKGPRFVQKDLCAMHQRWILRYLEKIIQYES